MAGGRSEALMRCPCAQIRAFHFRRQQRRVGTVDLQVLGRPVDRLNVQRGFLPEQQLAARTPDGHGQRHRSGRRQRVDPDEAEEAIALRQQRVGLPLPGNRRVPRAGRVDDDQHRVALRRGARRDVDQRRRQRLRRSLLPLLLSLPGLLSLLFLGCLRRLLLLRRPGLLPRRPVLVGRGRLRRLLIGRRRGLLRAAHTLRERIKPLLAAGRQQQPRARAAQRAQH